MPREVKLPELGENLEVGEVLDVKAGVGDTVSEGQTLIEVEAEKSTVEVPSPVAGRVTQWMVKKGDQVKVDQTICLIEGATAGVNGGAATALARESEQDVEAEPKFAARTTPSEKPSSEKPSPKVDGRKSRDNSGAPTPRPSPMRETPSRGTKLVPAGPATRRLARELGVDLGQVHGKAPGGRVTPDDIKDYVKQLASGTSTRIGTRQAPALPDFERWGPVERRALDPVRRRTAELMALAWSQVAQVTQHDEADISELDAFRRSQSKQGPKLTVTAFVLKAIAAVLKQFEPFNASLDMASNQLILKRYYHIGVAVDTERGLLVPVIRDVDRKSVHDLALELADVAERARNKKVSADEMRGGTFTVTNLGGIGGTAFTPIVNYPEVAILGLSRARMQPVVRDGQIVPRLIMPLSLSYDHRVIDGADAARFTRRVAELLENPMLMLVFA